MDTEALRAKFEKHGQWHIFAHWDDLTVEERETLLNEAAEIDLDELNGLVATLVKSEVSDAIDFAAVSPAPYEAHPSSGGEVARWQAAKARGEEVLRAGRVGAFVVAGGQGTRLGYEGPKGTFPVTPVRRRPLFAVFAEKILAAQKRYGVEIPWFIMTSHANHEETESFLEENRYFGLSREGVFLFRQGRMPAVDFEGKILLESKGRLAMSPDGHGGSLRALVRSGAVAEMDKRGIDILSYFQVDNPLVHLIDPAFIGFHDQSGSEMSSKMIPKAYAGEKVGHFCVREGKVCVIEYSDMPESVAEEREADGQLRFRAGSVAIHLLSRSFVERVGAGDGAFALPFHRAKKKVKVLDESGASVKPPEPNGIKFEMFVFDAIPYSQNPLIIEGVRKEEFSPVKNAEGKDSPETSRLDQVRQWTGWARAAGLGLAVDETGYPGFDFEVGPLFADSAEAFAERVNASPEPLVVESGAVFDV